jgi:hypothetical protein
MSVLNRLGIVAGTAAALVLVTQSVATADTPISSRPILHGPPPRLCKTKPTRPNYPLQAGSASCCAKPNYWQTFFSGGLEGTPRKYVWACAPAPAVPK